MLNIQESGNIDYVHEKKLNISLITVLNWLNNTILRDLSGECVIAVPEA